MREKIYLGLVHYPVYNRNQETVATSVTNFDIHDISRSCKTYDVKGYHIITPVDAQVELTSRVIGYWKDGFGRNFNKDREAAFSSTYVTESIEKTIEEIEKVEGKKPIIITTSARIYDNSISYENMSEKIYSDDNVYLLLFGTGHGLIDEIIESCTHILEPIRGKTKYNHLSVRSAVAIILDRLLGEK
ncbi:MAG: hypothetical protein B6227_05480 [Fusobacteriia bacterium 4572_74]|nr:MAG: hypothetical protein B6227_05480 [Fusobacteriia bacterium 4572_74]